MAAEGKWSEQGVDMQAEYIGIFDMAGRLELVDKSSGRTNPAALSRMAMTYGKELRKYREYIDGEFTGRNLEDVLVAEAMADLRKIDAKFTEKDLKNPNLKDALKRYTETFGSPASRRELQLELENKKNNEKLSENLSESIPKELATRAQSKGMSRGEKLELTEDIKKAIANSRNKNHGNIFIKNLDAVCTNEKTN